jgi:chromodomain-helicase-DNA-binding protein 7
LQPAEEPVIGKEKKRRKLDEIVLGLSAAKEQKSLFSDLKKSSTPGMISPSVTVTPASVSSTLGGPTVSSSSSPAPKPFTITVTSVPSPAAPGSSRSSIGVDMGVLPQIPTPKESFSTFLAHAEQQNLLLKKQQQQQQQSSLSQSSQVQRKTYESMIADLSKVADFSSKISSYSHEAKVCLCQLCIEILIQIIFEVLHALTYCTCNGRYLAKLGSLPLCSRKNS